MVASNPLIPNGLWLLESLELLQWQLFQLFQSSALNGFERLLSAIIGFERPQSALNGYPCEVLHARFAVQECRALRFYSFMLSSMASTLGLMLSLCRYACFSMICLSFLMIWACSNASHRSSSDRSDRSER